MEFSIIIFYFFIEPFPKGHFSGTPGISYCQLSDWFQCKKYLGSILELFLMQIFCTGIRSRFIIKILIIYPCYKIDFYSICSGSIKTFKTDSDYLQIDFPNVEQPIIAAQAPKAKMFSSFWQLVLEQNVVVIGRV